jgi:hypothetical protein
VVGGAAGTVQDNSLLGTDVLESSLDSTVLQFRGSTTSCPGGQVATAISAAGNLTCVPDANSGGDITGVTLTGGSGLTGGGTTGSVNLGTDATILQSRVSGTCVDGTAIQSIAQNGTPACENSIPGPPTGSASGGLSGTYPSPSIANGAVTGGAGGAITDGTVTGADVNESTLAFPGSFTAFSGPGGGTTPPSVPPVFIGATATVPVAAGDRMTGVASIPLWAASTDAVFWALCYQLGAGSVFVMETSQTGTVTTNHLSYTAVGTTSSLAAGTYTVGFCGHSPSALSNEYVQGWVMVTH